MIKVLATTLTLLLCLFTLTSIAQDSTIKKPGYIIIVNRSEIVTMDQVNRYAEKGLMKAMDKGVSEKDWKELSGKFGKAIGDDPLFVILISLYTPEEKRELDKHPPSTQPLPVKEDAGYLLNINDTAGDFTVKMIDGSELRLSDLRGKVVLLNFWATWCAPCIMEFHEIPDKILKPFDGKDFVFLPIAMGESIDVARAGMQKLNKKGIVFNSGCDPSKTIFGKYANASIPKNFLIDKGGVIRFVSTGNAEGRVDEIAREIQKLLGN